MAVDGHGIDSSKFGMTRIGTHTVLIPKESLTFENRKGFDAAIQKLTDENQILIVLDCKAVEFMIRRVREQ